MSLYVVLLLLLRFAWIEDYLMCPYEVGCCSPLATIETPHLILYGYRRIGASAGQAEIEFLCYFHSAPSVASMNMEDILLVVVFLWHFHTLYYYVDL